VISIMTENCGAGLRRRPRIVIAGGNAAQNQVLKAAFESEHYDVSVADTAAEVLGRACSGACDLIVLGQHESLELCRHIRQSSNAGILLLLRDDRPQQRIDALNAGADDHMPDPFIPSELLARIRALLRRVSLETSDEQIVLEDRSIALKSHEIRGPGGRVDHLTPKESLVLRYLVEHSDQPRSPQSLARNIWHRDGTGGVEYVRVVIRQLRRKLEPDPDNPRYILTDRALGYRFAFDTSLSARGGEGPSASTRGM
jgi:DNA-binding response OmpR family regulator